MRINRSFVCACILAVSFTALSAIQVNAQVAKSNAVISLKDALKEMLQKEGAASLKKLTVNVDDEKAASLEEKHHIDAGGSYTVYRGIGDSGEVIGSTVIVNEEGKEGPLQVLISMRPDGQIYDVGFTVFGEDKGKSTLAWGYLKQFIDKSPDDPLTIGQDIDGVSGATWTSESISKAVKRAVVIYEAFLLVD